MAATAPEKASIVTASRMPADDDQPYGQALARLSSLLIDAVSLEQILQDVLGAIEVATPRVTAASVTTIGDDGSYVTAATTDSAAQQVDEFEYAHNTGPCVTALQTGQEYLVENVDTDPRWPEFGRAAAAAGFGAVAGLPLRSGGQTHGALNLFAAEADGLVADDLAVCRRLATPVGAALANARAFRATDRLTHHLQARLDEVAVLNRAVGVLMAERGCDAEAATDVLHRTAEATGRSVADVAQQIAAAIGPGPALCGAAPGGRARRRARSARRPSRQGSRTHRRDPRRRAATGCTAR
jgi:transcriptional regulator with GAF, ATPase, and Fis domain